MVFPYLPLNKEMLVEYYSYTVKYVVFSHPSVGVLQTQVHIHSSNCRYTESALQKREESLRIREQKLDEREKELDRKYYNYKEVIILLLR